jgi:hypothetical protein
VSAVSVVEAYLLLPGDGLHTGKGETFDVVRVTAEPHEVRPTVVVIATDPNGLRRRITFDQLQLVRYIPGSAR